MTQINSIKLRYLPAANLLYRSLLALLFVLVALSGFTQPFHPLWPEGKKPNYNGKVVTDTVYNDRIWAVGTPGFFSFLVPKEENKGAAVLICPGGGYARLSYLYNGYNLAKWLNTQGVNAFVLLYRLPHQKDLIHRGEAPLQDAQRAMKIIRSHADQWNINPQKIGVLGSSAGGHVAGMLGTRNDDVSIIKDGIDHYPFRPDFMALISPVVTMGKYAHPGSRIHLLGPDTSSQKMTEKYSNEKQVTANTPPTFIVHAYNDKTVSVQNSLMLNQALIDSGVNTSLHVFPQGQHGLNLINNPGSADLWYDLLRKWLVEMNFNELSIKSK